MPEDVLERISARNRLLYNTSKLRNRPDVIIALVLIVVFGFLVLGPLLQIIYTSITYQSYDLRVVREAREGQLTLYHYIRVFTGRLSRALFFKPFVNSLMVGFGVTALAMLVGSLLAWAMVRTDIPWKRFFHGIIVIPYMMPSWVIALAWMIIFKNDRVAGEQGMLTYLTGLSPPDWFS